MCEEEKNNIKALDNGVLESWKRGVVTSDGVYNNRNNSIHNSYNSTNLIVEITSIAKTKLD